MERCPTCNSIMKTFDKTKKQGERLLDLLSDGQWHSYAEISSLYIGNHTGRISDLRKLGHEIEPRKIKGQSSYEYRLVQKAAAQQA